MKHIQLYILALLVSTTNFAAFGQKQAKNPKVKLPDIPGYITLKCDFHMHTALSDGHVWPSFRVTEAEKDGLDAISITEHIDMEKFPDEIKRDRERGHAIALAEAAKTHVLVIKGAEISPRVPPYHNNAIFLKDLNKLPYSYMKQSQKKFVMKDNIRKEELMAPFLEAKKQDAFVFYNHPTYGWWDKKDPELFTGFHKELLDKGILGGVEVVNGQRYNLIAHRIAEKYNLTLVANSDAHHEVNDSKNHRPMTLVFAKEKTESAIKEALLNRRTVIYSGNFIIGRRPEAEAFFKASLTVAVQKKTGKNTPQLEVKITNNSDVPYEVKCSSEYIIEEFPLGKITLKPHEVTTLVLNPVWKYPEVLTLKMEVSNVLVSSEKCLETEIQVPIK